MSSIHSFRCSLHPSLPALSPTSMSFPALQPLSLLQGSLPSEWHQPPSRDTSQKLGQQPRLPELCHFPFPLVLRSLDPASPSHFLSSQCYSVEVFLICGMVYCSSPSWPLSPASTPSSHSQPCDLLTLTEY